MEPREIMPKSDTESPDNHYMARVHALGHPSSPMPQTRWPMRPGAKAGTPPQPATITTPPPIFYAPNTPAAPSLAQGTGSALIVTWTAPSVDSTHNAATGFALRSSPSGANTWTAVPGVTSPYTLSGLTAGAAIDVQIQASNTGGVSTWSTSSTLTTGVAAPNAPAISSVTAPPDGTTAKLTAAWTAPAVDANHGAATGYNIRYSPSGANSWITVTGVTSPYTLTGLGGGARIDVQVQATNPASGPWSGTTTATTWGATVTPGAWQPAASQTHNASVAPNGGVQMFATAAPTAVTGASFAWSASNSVVPASGLISAGSDGQTNGWGQYFNAPATAGTYYLWSLAQGAGGTIGALVSAAISVT
jgi:Fibronectin type III domain